jgi:uncharacterized membrane protein YedE/YeeE
VTLTHEPSARSAATALSAGRFGRHYVEMVLAMAVGMAVYGILFRSPLDPTGYRTVLQAHPYFSECLMLLAMSIPMAAFMQYRNHGWRRTTEMVVGMVLPAVAVICLVAFAAVPAFTDSTLSLWSHAAMLLGMLAAMLYRRGEYASPHLHHAPKAGN